MMPIITQNQQDLYLLIEKYLPTYITHTISHLRPECNIWRTLRGQYGRYTYVRVAIKSPFLFVLSQQKGARLDHLCLAFNFL